MPAAFAHATKEPAKTPRPRLRVSQPRDPEEQEADRMADAVLRMPAPAPGESRCGCGTCSACGQAAKPSSGQPLPASERAFFEPRFGHDFSRVRIHADAAATASARSYGALAYTYGQDIVFGAGQYAPGTAAGRQLLAHELAHVTQQPLPAASPLIRRQEGGAAGAPAARDFAGCSPANDIRVENWIRIGREAVGNAVADLEALLAGNPNEYALRDMTENAFRWHFFSSDPRHMRRALPYLKYIHAIMGRRRWNWACSPTEAHCRAHCGAPAAACAGPNGWVQICPNLFGHNDMYGAEVMIHESAHQAGLMGNIVFDDFRRYSAQTPAQALQNADSYALFAMSNTYDQPRFGVADYWPYPILWTPDDLRIWLHVFEPSDHVRVLMSGGRRVKQRPLTVRDTLRFGVYYFVDTEAHPRMPVRFRPPHLRLLVELTRFGSDQQRAGRPAQEVLSDLQDDRPRYLRPGTWLESTIPTRGHVFWFSREDRGEVWIAASLMDPDSRQGVGETRTLPVDPDLPEIEFEEPEPVKPAKPGQPARR